MYSAQVHKDSMKMLHLS